MQISLPIDADTPDEDIIPYADAALDDIQDVNAHIVLFPPVVGTLSHSAAGLSRPAGQGNELDFVIVTKTSETAGGWIVRRPTPLEAERLQGFPDYWTDVPFKGKLPSDTVRYQALGNSMPVPVMEFIGREISRHFRVMLKHEKMEKGLVGKPPSANPVFRMMAKGTAKRLAFLEED